MNQLSQYWQDQITCCRLCPRQCGIDRTRIRGFCGCGPQITAARAALHHWEEPCLSGSRGSGTIFFSGCTLRCCFCQNHTISQEGSGKTISPEQLENRILYLQDQGAHNINLVTPTQFLPWIIPALDQAKRKLTVPVVYNCGGYETVETVKALSPYIDIWLPDLKYRSAELSRRYSGAGDYFFAASAAIRQMIGQTGPPVFDKGHRLLKRGVILRHMVLPGQKNDSIQLLNWMASNLPKDHFLISLLSQYTPFYNSSLYPELNRRITTYEYEYVVKAALKLGFDHGFMQKRSSAKEEYTPPFDLEGL